MWKDKAETEGNTYRDRIEQLQWRFSKQILTNGIDVIIEWGTWGKDERDRLRSEAKALGSSVKLYYLHAEKEVMKARIIERNKNLGDHEFLMSNDSLDVELDKAIAIFQPPTVVEMGMYDE